MISKIKLGYTDALILVDIQNDFLPGGSLPVLQGDLVIPILNQYLVLFKKVDARIFATRDWHPPNHISFLEYGGIWPSHCVRDTKGAKFPSTLKLPEKVVLISKATDPIKEGYSGFENTDLLKILKKNHIKRLFIGGLAIEYCVKNTVLDALNFGFETFFLYDGSRGINSNLGDVDKAIESMKLKGAKKVELKNFNH